LEADEPLQNYKTDKLLRWHLRSEKEKRRTSMTVRRSGLLWGILLIGAGVLALAQQMGALQRFPEQVWIWGSALISALGVVSYALSRWKEWGWLFPAGIFGGLAVTTALAMANVSSAAVASPLFVGLLIPFAAAYLTDRSRNWWALIPGGVMLFLVLTTLLVGTTGGEWVGALFLFMIALGFLIVYLNNHTRTWAGLVAYIVAVLGIAPAMASNGQLAAYYGAVFLLATALPFIFLYLRSSNNWWALIPASALILLSIITFAAVAGWINSPNGGGYAGALLMGGLAAAFAVIWRRHTKPWAKVVAIVLAALAVISGFFAAQSEVLWPVAIILAGAYLLVTTMRKKTV
jgi:hypothetical protein